ncbi:trypsin-like peptidase domain-containing protein, partial [bacterium]|nr:trypsin-like peptidase domain-containing protein [bacterium]
MLNENNTTLKKFSALVVLAVTFTLLGILFASRMEWTPQSSAEPDSGISEALQSSGLINEQGESPFVAVAQKVKPSVVNIVAKKQSKGKSRESFDFGPFRDFFPPDMFPENPHGTTSGGSGIIVDQHGFILTNNHVVEDATEITVKDADGHEYKAEVIGTDPQTDLAVIKIEDGKFKPHQVAEFGDSDAIKVGDWAIAIGNPYGLDFTVTVGVISAKGRSNLAIAGGGPVYQNFIQTDASINFGNSGGPLIDVRGRVVGVNTAINAQAQGIGFAIPIKLAKNIYEQLRTDGEVVRGYLGMVPRELDDATREALGLDRDVQGVFVDMVEEGTPADKGGLKAGDVITKVDDFTVNDPSSFRFMIADKKPDSKIGMDILRDGKRKELNFKLGNRADFAAGTPHNP